MTRHEGSPPLRAHHPRATRVLAVAVLSSATVVVLASVLITSVFFTASDAAPAANNSRVSLAAERPLTIAVARTAGGPSEWRTYARAIKRMSEATGRPIRVRYALDRSEAVRLVASQEVDGGFLCTNCYLELADDPDVHLIASPRIAGERKDAAVLVVRSGSPYSSLKTLTGRRVGVTDPSSLAGYTYLYWLASREHVDVARSLDVVRRETEEQNVKALLAGEVEAVVVNRSQLALWNHAGLTIVSQSPEFGMPPFVVGSTVDTATRSAMEQALLTMRGSSETPISLVQGFQSVTGADYAFARELARFSTTLPDSK